MRSITFCLFLLLIATGIFAQTTEQAVDKVTIGKLQRFYNNNQPDSLFKYFDPIMKSGLPVDKVGTLFTQMKTQLGTLKQTTFLSYQKGAAVYKGEFQNDILLVVVSTNTMNQINGLYFKPNTELPPPTDKAQGQAAQVKAMAAPVMDPSLAESPVTLKTLGGTLSGTLTMPKNVTGKVPVVLIIAGSGPTDRNGNSTQGVKAYTYQYIAEELGKAGIASLRYDKRGIGQSTSSEKEIDSKFTNFVDDASALIIMLKDDPRFSKIIILGHSEGSLVGMVAAFIEHESISAVISAAGAGEPADHVLTKQIKKTQPPSVADEFKTIIDSLRKGKTVPKVDPALYFIARPSIQPYLMSWMVFDPARVIHKLKMPVLIIQGTADLQVTVEDAETLKKGRSEAQLKIIEGMNHVLKAAPEDREKNLATYNNPSLPIMPEFMTAVVGFIKALKN